MNKESLLDDMNFRHKCHTYGLDYNNFEIINDIIILTSPKDNIIVLLDKHYTTIDIFDKNDVISKLVPICYRIKLINDIYENTYNKLPYPFQELSLKQINELANRIDIDETNHGHSIYMLVNGELVNDESNSDYITLLSYIKFIGLQVEEYYKNLYQMIMMGFEYPNVYQYISSLINNINECIDINGKRTLPRDILEYLGQGLNNIGEYGDILFAIIELLYKQKNDKIITDLSEISKQLLKILEVPDKTVNARYKKINKTFEINEINLESWLTQDDNKNKTLLLMK